MAKPNSPWTSATASKEHYTHGFKTATVSMFILPDFPESKTGSGKWLFSEEERKFAMDRIAKDRVSAPEEEEGIMHGLKLAVKDYRTWVFVGLPIILPPPAQANAITVPYAMSQSQRLQLQQILPNHSLRFSS